MKPLFKIVIVLLLIVGAFVIFYNLTIMQSKPTAVEVYAPRTEPTNVSYGGKTFTIVLDGDNVYGYEEAETNRTILADSTAVANYLKRLQEQHRDAFQVVIKSSKAASYQSVVDILDHMTIQKIKNFTLEELGKEDFEQISQK